MKKYFPKLSINTLPLAIIFVVGGFIFPNTAHAFDWFGLTDIASDIFLSPLGWLAVLMLQIASLLTYLSGAILNYAVQYSVVDMAKNLEQIGTISDAWKVIRDVANIGFIFVLLYAAIETILGIGKENQRLIVRIVVVAILINFSLFFTKFVIDVSNVIAMTFYDAIVPGALTNTATGIFGKSGIADSLMNPLKITSLWDIEGIVFEGKDLIIIGIMGTIVTLIAAFVFFAVALMFIIRFVVLVFVLILSPIAFVSFVLPNMDKYRAQWSDALIGQAFFAPIYFLLTWIVIMVSKGVLLSQGGSLATAFVGTVGPNGEAIPPTSASIGILVNFIIMIALLIASLTISKEWSNKAGSVVGKMTSWATGAAGGVTLGMAGRFGRGTIGRAGQALAENKWLKDKAPTSIAARLALATTRKTAGASFDVRGTNLDLGAGKAQKGGFTKDMEDKIKAEKKYGESFKASEIEIRRAEQALENAKKLEGPDAIRKVADAQDVLDKLKGVSEEDVRNRRIKELIAERGMSKKEARDEVNKLEALRLRKIDELRKGGMSEEAAKAEVKAKNIGLEIERIKSVGVERQEAYIKDKEAANTTIGIGKYSATIPHFSFTGRVGFVGKVKRERLEEAAAIRKATKEKKPAEKISEQIRNEAESTADTVSTPETTATDTSGTGATPTTST